MEKIYSINVADATKDSFMIGMMIAPVTRSKQIISVGNNIDDMAIVLDCPQERAKAIIDVIRMRHDRNDIRCYENKNRI